MARASQASLERAYYQDFAEHCPLAPKGQIEFSDKPDVLITDSDLLGVEVANIYRKDGQDLASEQIQSRLRADVIRQARELYLVGTHPQYEFWFDFDPDVPITNTQELSRRVYDCVVQAAKEQRQYAAYKGFEGCPELRYLNYNGIEYADAQWRPVQSYDVPPLDVKRVLEIVESKAAKAASYQRCDRYWLLLIVEFWDPAQDQHLSWDASTKAAPTPFERIVIYKPATREWLEVPQQQSIPAQSPIPSTDSPPTFPAH